MLLLSFPFKSEYNCERLLLTSYWLIKAYVRFVVPRVFPICDIHCSYYPFVLWCLWDIVNLHQKWWRELCIEPEMLCRPLWLHSDVGGWSSQTWETYVWWSFRNGCTILCYGPTTPSVCLIWYPELWLCVSVHALDTNDMNATSKTTLDLLFGICY